MELSATLRLPLIPKSNSSPNPLSFNCNLSNSTHLFFKKHNYNFNMNTPSRSQKNRFVVKSMFGLGVPELVVIVGVTTLLFGPKMVPQLGKSIGQSVRGFQQAAKEFESELKKESQPESETESLTDATVVSEEQQDAKAPGKVDSL